ncbi:MAG: hypothetical protein ACE5ES_04185, partial [Candidatus Nanoarchaeia archaeon]
NEGLYKVGVDQDSLIGDFIPSRQDYLTGKLNELTCEPLEILEKRTGVDIRREVDEKLNRR